MNDANISAKKRSNVLKVKQSYNSFNSNNFSPNCLVFLLRINVRRVLFNYAFKRLEVALGHD